MKPLGTFWGARGMLLGASGVVLGASCTLQVLVVPLGLRPSWRLGGSQVRRVGWSAWERREGKGRKRNGKEGKGRERKEKE